MFGTFSSQIQAFGDVIPRMQPVWFRSKWSIPSLKLTWHLKITLWERRFLLETIIFRGYVSFRECIDFGKVQSKLYWRQLPRENAGHNLKNTSLRIMGSQVPGGLEIRTLRHYRVKPLFFGGFLRVEDFWVISSPYIDGIDGPNTTS